MFAALDPDFADLDPHVVVGKFCNEIARRESVEEDREDCKDLHEFILRAWSSVEPSVAFRDGWYIGAIAEHLEALVTGEIRNLCITMPPRHLKSGCCSVMFPAWVWGPGEHPEWRFLTTSYASGLSIRDALKTRRLIVSRWYQDRWGDRFKLTGDQNAKIRYENDHGGHRIASSVGGLGTGEGGDVIVVDDPHNLTEVYSDVIRKGVLDWWDNTMATRLNDPKTGRRLIVMQRGHYRDLVGHVLGQGGYEHLNLPAEFEGSRKKTVIGWSDPRKKKGDLLAPDRFGHKELAELKLRLGPYGTASQLQQRPTPEEGGIFKKAWFKLWPHDVKLPFFHTIIQSYDTAFTDVTANDRSAGTTWGLFTHPKFKSCTCIMLLDAWTDWLNWPDVRKRVRMESKARFGEDQDAETNPGKGVDLILIENKGSGITLIMDLQMIGINATPYNPKLSDKTVRAHASTPFAAAGLVYVMGSGVAGPDGGPLPVSWAVPFIDQMLKFAPGKNANDEDDYVDTFTQLVLYLRDTYQIEAAAGPSFPEDIEEDYYEDEDVGNPYNA